jgi:hypothetical protein
VSAPDIRATILAAGIARHGTRAAFDRRMAEVWDVAPGTAQRRLHRLLGRDPPAQVTEIEALMGELGLAIGPAEKSTGDRTD